MRARVVVLLIRIAHCTLRVVHRTCHHTQVWNLQVVIDLTVSDATTALCALQTEHRLEIHHIRIGTIHSRRLLATVEVEHKLILGSYLGKIILEVGHLHIVTVEEIDLKAFDTHLGKVATNLLLFALHGVVARPEDDAYALRVGVVDNRLQIDLGDNLFEVVGILYCPTLVEDYILDAILGCEIGVVVVGFGINTCLERHAY